MISFKTMIKGYLKKKLQKPKIQMKTKKIIKIWLSFYKN